MPDRNALGALLPSSNSVVEQEIQDFLFSEFASFSRPILHVSRISYKTRYNLDPVKFLNEIGTNAVAAMRNLETLNLKVIGFFCSSAGYQMTRTETYALEAGAPCPVVFSHIALIEACRWLCLGSLLLITPYEKAIGVRVADNLMHAGFKVERQIHLGLSNAAQFINLGSEIEHIVECNYSDESGIIIACTNVPTFRSIRTVEERTKVPMVSSNQATLWMMLKTQRAQEKRSGSFGRLFG